MANSMDLTQPRTLQKTVYSGVRLAQRVRWNVPAEFKPIFDVESDPLLWDAPIEVRAEKAGVSELDYQRALERFERMPVVRLAIVIMRTENDFLQNWWVQMKKAEKLAEEIEEPATKAKTILMVEREKQMGIKRLVETGRMIDPDEYTKKVRKVKPKKPRPIVSADGVVDIEKIP